MATKKTTTEKKTTARTTKPKLTVVKEEQEQPELTVFEKVAIKFPFEQHEVEIADGITVNVRNRIGLGEMMALVRNIVDACVDEDRGEVHFELFDYVTKMSICAVFCNEVVPENNEIGYLAAVGAGRLYEKVAEHIDQEQLQNIWMASRDDLRSKNELFCSAAAKVTIDMLQRINELYEMISNVTENFDGEEAIKAVKNLSVLTTGK